MLIFFGGCMKKECLEARKKIKSLLKEKFPNAEIYDPYRNDWNYKNIYDKIEALYKCDFAVFYGGGELTEKEIHLAKNVFGKKVYIAFFLPEFLPNFEESGEKASNILFEVKNSEGKVVQPDEYGKHLFELGFGCSKTKWSWVIDEDGILYIMDECGYAYPVDTEKYKVEFKRR